MQTADLKYHYINIKHIHKYFIDSSKGNHIEFYFKAKGFKEYCLTNKNAEIFDYDLIDRIIKGVTIETNFSNEVKHRLFKRRTPAHLLQ